MAPQLLLIAEPLLGAGLIRLIDASEPAWKVCADPGELDAPPALVLWAPGADLTAQQLPLQLQLLRQRWQPAPLLLLLPAGHRLPPPLLLQLSAPGVLEAPAPDTLLAALHTLLAGGRVLDLLPASHTSPEAALPGPGLGLGQWLLLSGLQQVDGDIQACLRLLAPPTTGLVQRLVLEGRLRELHSARQLLLLLWGPASLAWGSPSDPAPERPTATGTALTLQQRNAEGIWDTLQARLRPELQAGPVNGSGQLLALEALRPERRSDLLLGLLDQLQAVRRQFSGESLAAAAMEQRWQAAQPQVLQQALQALASPYVQLPREGTLCAVADTLIRQADLEVSDPELPPAAAMLASLVRAEPLLVEGQLLPADEPRAVLHLELLVSNWLVRNGEQLAAEVLASCADWPELRRYLLQPELLATRNLERLRNQLNAQLRWQSWWQRPIALYESRRLLYALHDGHIGSVSLVEPRDGELRQLGWPQQLVTLALESRDALAPQVQALARGLGRLLVVLLTEVLGRAIGLVGRGVLQGMGRSLRASQ